MRNLLKSLVLILMNQRGEAGEGGEAAGGEAGGNAGGEAGTQGGEAAGGESGNSGGEAGSLLGGEAGSNNPENTGQTTGKGGEGQFPTEPDNNYLNQIYGELAGKIQWPEGVEDGVKQSPSLKPFVKEDGNVDYASLMKSYTHTKSKMGEKGIQVPTEHSPQEEWDSFFENVGYKKDLEAYKHEVKKPEDSKMSDEFAETLTKKLHEQRVPAKQAQEMLGFFEEQMGETLDQSEKELAKQQEEHVGELKKEWGQAFDQKVNLAKKVVSDHGNEELQKLMDDPRFGSNKSVVKMFSQLGEKLYGEDDLKGSNSGARAVTPEQAQQEINRVMGDPNHPYFKSDHPAHKDEVARVKKLFEAKNS